MKINIYAIFLPRIELFFIREWVDHHLEIGVEKIYLYNNGFKSFDESSLAKNVPEKIGEKDKIVKWNKKPGADYNLELSDTEILMELEKIENEYDGRLEIKDWAAERANSNSVFHPQPRKWSIKKSKNPDKPFFREYPGSQFNGARHILETQKELSRNFFFNRPDFWLFIDIDEFIFLKKHLNLQELIEEYDQYDRLSFRQIIFDERINKKPVKEIVNYGFLSENVTKSMAKTCGIKRFVPHSCEVEGETIFIDREIAEMHHYRGMPWSGPILRDADEEIKTIMKKHGPCKKVYNEIRKYFSKTILPKT